MATEYKFDSAVRWDELIQAAGEAVSMIGEALPEWALKFNKQCEVPSLKFKQVWENNDGTSDEGWVWFFRGDDDVFVAAIRDHGAETFIVHVGEVLGVDVICTDWPEGEGRNLEISKTREKIRKLFFKDKAA